MLSKLVSQNSKRSRKDNGLFFGSMIISVIAFYIILSLSNQDVVIFLKKMESVGINKLLTLVPVFYVFTLFILFVLVYFASSIQMERRNHEFGVYLTMGMKKRDLFRMIILEDFRNSLFVMGIGIPVAIIISELISLVTAKLIGIGIIGHRFNLSISGIVFTVIGFFAVKLIVFLVLSGKVVSKEIGELLFYKPVGTWMNINKKSCILAFIFGVALLGIAYYLGISERMWSNLIYMALVVICGTIGTILIFYFFRLGIEFVMKKSKKVKLYDFNFRQIQEGITAKSHLLAVSSLLLLLTFCFGGFGLAVSMDSIKEDTHILDYTFTANGDTKIKDIKNTLKEKRMNSSFKNLIEIKLGQKHMEKNSIDVNTLTKELSANVSRDFSEEFNQLVDGYLISESGYNQLLKAGGKKSINLKNDEIAMYLSKELFDEKEFSKVDKVLKKNIKMSMEKEKYRINPKLQTTNFVTDKAITIGVAWIVPDDKFNELTKCDYDSYLGGIVTPKLIKEKGLMLSISDINEKLSDTNINYESYIQNYGRQILYVVSASYLTLYLAIIFLVSANTIIGIQFLMGQQKSFRRYRILIHLGGDYDTMCKAAAKQVNGYFGIPIFMAIINAIFGSKTLFAGLLPAVYKEQTGKLWMIVGFVLIVIALVEYIYIKMVKRSSNAYIWSLMQPIRED